MPEGAVKVLDDMARDGLDPARVPGNVLLAHRRNVTSECGEDGILDDGLDGEAAG